MVGYAKKTYSVTYQRRGLSRRDIVDGWLDELRDDAEFNIASYVDCFLSENLARRYISERKLPLSKGVKSEADDWRMRESQKKKKANLSYDIRKNDGDIEYLGMDALAVTVEGKKAGGGEQSVTLDAIEYAPVRNVVGHTGLLTGNGKKLLGLKYENIKARIKTLVAENPPAKKEMMTLRQTTNKINLELIDPSRSALMARVRQKHSAPEREVRRLLRGLNVSYKLHPKSLPGTPDIIVAEAKCAIFVHGCFWHRHPSCPKATMPKTRVTFWRDKFKKMWLATLEKHELYESLVGTSSQFGSANVETRTRYASG